MRLGALLPLFLACISIVGVCQNKEKEEVEFPSSAEIKLVLDQADRAFGTYESHLGLQEGVLPKKQIDQDKEVVAGWRQVSKLLSANRDLFNSHVGFLVIVDLDDASRNSGISSGQASLIAVRTLEENGDLLTAKSAISVAQVAQDDSALLYTVSENATQLYQRYLIADMYLKRQMSSSIDECAVAIKKLQGERK
jgi:hypothetical protein